MIEVVPFTASHIVDASRLFADTYDEARSVLPLIPERSDVADFSAKKLEAIENHPGFAAFEGKRLVGYMVELFTSDSFMSRPTGFAIELFPCAAIREHRGRIYQLLYKQMSESWIKRGFHAHQFSLFATDDALAYTFFRLSFGMTHFQLFRDLTPPAGEIAEVEIRYLDSEELLRDLDKQHYRYYPNPPLFWIPHDYFDHRVSGSGEEDRVLSGEGETIAAFADGNAVGYFGLKKGTAETELLAHPGNGQISAAYARPEYRGQGIGKALLAETVRWAERNNLERLYVEGESANIYAGNFWTRHFRPVEYSVRRCIDDRINPTMFTSG